MASDLEQKIIRQIEYYFGDYNLPRDKFLKEKVKEDEGWVDLSILLTFKRLATLSTDTEVILKALEKSESGIIAINEDRTKIRRVPEKPIPEFDDERKKELMLHTAYAKGFPADETLDNILTFLETYGQIDSCIKRSYLDRATKEHVFKGSCFIVFKNVDECKAFVEAENIKYKDIELIRKWQSVYLDEKKEEINSHKEEKKLKRPAKETVEETKKTVTYPKGVFLHFSRINKDKVITREEVKEAMLTLHDKDPAFIDFKKGDDEGHIRLTEENEAQEFYKKLTDGVLEHEEIKLQFKVLEGEEEELYLEKTISAIASIRGRNHQKKFSRGSKRHYSGHGGHNGPRAKKAKHY